ncbi:hypothetical protein ES702_07614 [subsurface metagenome]
MPILVKIVQCEVCNHDIHVDPSMQEVTCQECGSVYEVHNKRVMHGPFLLGSLQLQGRRRFQLMPDPGVLHGPAGLGTWQFAVSTHALGFAGPYAPAEVGPGEDFEMTTEIICFTAGCDFTGNTFEVRDIHTDELIATGTFTERFWNVPAGKWGSRGRIILNAPLAPGNYWWVVKFPQQVSKQ